MDKLKQTLQERMGVDKGNSYWKSNIVFWMVVSATIMFVIWVVYYVVYDYSIHTPKCKLMGYTEYHNREDVIEPGYILCCRYELINHIKEHRCDAIKE